jgi:hypothetical protein
MRPSPLRLHRAPWIAAAFYLAAFSSVPHISRAASPILEHYEHIFLIVEENHGYNQIIRNPAAPNLNQLASGYGLATKYFSVADPSAPNYVAMLGGNFFGITDDNPYYTHTVDKPSLMSQLDAAGLSWKGYFQSIPYAGFRGICYPGRCNGVPDFDPQYASKHNGIPYFESIQDSDAEFGKIVPLARLKDDLDENTLPAFAYLVPDQCHDMHGSPPYCIDSGNPGDPQDQYLVKQGDLFVGVLVDQIKAADFWQRRNNAIVITFDEGNGSAGCCDANPGTGQVATIVVTSHGPRGFKDSTPYNHYSLLQTFQRIFRLGCLEFTCDTANVTPMEPLFSIAGERKNS